MAKSEMKNVVMIMMMLILAEASYSLTRESPNSIGSVVKCAGECAVKCVDHLGDEIKYAECFAGCIIFTCHEISSQAVYDCTTRCAYSKLKYINTDAHGVIAIVNSCFKTCKDKM
ncbi:unnamed protein product [Lathyrus sativus]|nr:unnamed protein product [Lathyrus sativus]